LLRHSYIPSPVQRIYARKTSFNQHKTKLYTFPTTTKIYTDINSLSQYVRFHVGNWISIITLLLPHYTHATQDVRTNVQSIAATIMGMGLNYRYPNQWTPSVKDNGLLYSCLHPLLNDNYSLTVKAARGGAPLSGLYL
jgi:hypothetical protein